MPYECRAEPALNLNDRQENISLEVGPQFEGAEAWKRVDPRRHPRYKLETDIRVYPHNEEVIRGHTVDLSESGISAILQVEVALGEVVRLEFSLQLGDVVVHALVRQRNAFRYGFQFVEASSAQDTIGRTCRQLSVEQSLAAYLGR